jgi:hypothetical protein
MAGEFSAAGHALIKELGALLEKGAHEVMAEADYLIPKDTETARESHRIFPVVNDGATIQVTFGYGFGGARNPKTGNPIDEYIVPLHEILEARHDPPTQAKFLEQPLFAYAGHMGRDISAELRIEWGKRL